MTQGSELEKLEKFVEKILQQNSLLKTAQENLEETVASKEAKIKELEASLLSLQQEKNDVNGRVTKLIAQIEEWEEGGEPSEEIEDGPGFEEAKEIGADTEAPNEVLVNVDDSNSIDTEASLEEDELVDDESPESRQGSLFSTQSGVIYRHED